MELIGKDVNPLMQAVFYKRCGHVNAILKANLTNAIIMGVASEKLQGSAREIARRIE